MEILSPAGNLQAAYSAFKGGADAVYVGGKSFSARASAENFSNDELREITQFAHSIGKKIYVTLNTLIFQNEFDSAVEFATFLYQINVDGVIIQDLGLANYLHKTLPNLPLNASTQLNCHNIEQAEALIKIGFKRIVLARESSIEFAKEVKKLGVEVEVFGHGALCVSYSGNCLMSSFIGGRSGNRGRCAQPCRMKYDLLEDGRKVKEEYFAISTKDLMTIDKIEEFIDAGVDSLKIEGRLKSNEYIYAVSKAYREALDYKNKNINKENKEKLSVIFNRKFTEGYVFNESKFQLINTNTSSHQGEVIGKVISSNKERLSIQLNSEVHRLDGIRFNGSEQFGLAIEKMFVKREPVEHAFKGQIIELTGIEKAEKYVGQEVIKTKDYLLNKAIENELKETIKVNVKASFICKPLQPTLLKLTLGNITIESKGESPQIASGDGTKIDRLYEQMLKSGSYPYVCKDIKIDYEKCFIPISSINKLRNDAFEQLRLALIKENSIERKEKYISEYKPQTSPIKCKAIVENTIQNEMCESQGIVTFSHFDKDYFIHERICNSLDICKENEIVSFVILPKSKYCIASQYCNITNSYALDCFYELGFKECILSLELDKPSISELIKDFVSRHGVYPNIGIIAYGKPDVMIMKSCPIGTLFHNKEANCGRCHNRLYELKDRIGERYHLLGDKNCNIRILLDKNINLFENIEELDNLGIQNIYFLFTDESKEKVREVISHYYKNDSKFNPKEETKGHYINRPL